MKPAASSARAGSGIMICLGNRPRRTPRCRGCRSTVPFMLLHFCPSIRAIVSHATSAWDQTIPLGLVPYLNIKGTDVQCSEIGVVQSGSTGGQGVCPLQNCPRNFPICFTWNNGHCSRDPCHFRHIYVKCKGDHKASKCTALLQKASKE